MDTGSAILLDRPSHRANAAGFVAGLVVLTATLASAQSLPPAPAGVHVTTEYGIEFSTVTSSRPGDAFIASPSVSAPPEVAGSGQAAIRNRLLSGSLFADVPEAYRISRTEVTHSQYISMLNMYVGQRTYQDWLNDPIFGVFVVNGARTEIAGNDGNGQYRYFGYESGTRTSRAMPMNIISAMLFCNWLHNDRPSDYNQLRTGAYDIAQYLSVTTSSPITTGVVNPLPGARFFIPSQAQWIRASHFDPNRYGPGEGGYWLYPNGTDSPSVAGIPGIGTANLGWTTAPADDGGELESIDLPVGSYPQTQTPWGLLDASGGLREITSTVPYLVESGFPIYGWDGTSAITEGGAAGADPTTEVPEHLYYFSASGARFPSSGRAWTAGEAGFRIAATIPAPGTSAFVLITVFVVNANRRRYA